MVSFIASLIIVFITTLACCLAGLLWGVYCAVKGYNILTPIITSAIGGYTMMYTMISPTLFLLVILP